MLGIRPVLPFAIGGFRPFPKMGYHAMQAMQGIAKSLRSRVKVCPPVPEKADRERMQNLHKVAPKNGKLVATIRKTGDANVLRKRRFSDLPSISLSSIE